jgi:hypothetical protein
MSVARTIIRPPGSVFNQKSCSRAQTILTMKRTVKSDSRYVEAVKQYFITINNCTTSIHDCAEIGCYAEVLSP